jgi:putative transposase
MEKPDVFGGAKNIRDGGLKPLIGQDIGRIVYELNGAVRPLAAETRRGEQAVQPA